MKLYERYGDSGFHTCLMTTFGVDFDAFESIVLPRLRGAGCFNNALLVDDGMLAYVLENPLQLPAYAGRQYTLTAVGGRGVFHPKLTLQLGRRGGRLIVASANMTASGLAGNLELAGVIESGPDQAGERGLLAACWAFLSDAFPTREQGLAYQLDWMRRRTVWLFDTEPASGAVTLNDGTTAALLVSGEAIGIGARFAALVEERPVTRLIVLSPYWDENLTALAFLIDELKPAQTVILVDAAKALFSGHAAQVLPNAAIFDLAPFGKSRFIHAKAIIAETAAADYVLYGSANCTVAALGARNMPGSNQEACLCRRLAPGTVLDELGLTRLLGEASPIPPAALPGWTSEKELPLAEAIQRSPGRFECMFDRLSVAVGSCGVRCQRRATRPEGRVAARPTGISVGWDKRAVALPDYGNRGAPGLCPGQDGAWRGFWDGRGHGGRRAARNDPRSAGATCGIRRCALVGRNGRRAMVVGGAGRFGGRGS
jgi:hypothetical protein